MMTEDKRPSSPLHHASVVVDDVESASSTSPIPTAAAVEESDEDGSKVTSWSSFFLYDSRIRYLAALSFVLLLLSMDQNLLAPSLTTVAKEFNLTDVERDMYLGGYLSLAYFISGGLTSIVCGYATDKQVIKSRILLFSSVIFAGELAGVLTILVTDFTGLLVTRVFAGIAMGGSMPLAYSLIGDIFIDSLRGRAIGMFCVMTGFGVLAGQFVAGIMSPEYGWRSPFVAVSIPGLVVTTMFACFAREPKRAAGERALHGLQAEYNEKMSFRKLHSRSMWILLFSSLPNALPWGFLLVYAQDFLMQDCGLSNSESMIVVVAFSVASGVGTVISGIIFDLLWKRRIWLAPLVTAFVVAASAAPMFVMIHAAEHAPQLTFAGFCGCAMGSGVLVSQGVIAKNTMLLNCSLPETRGTIFGMNTVVDDLGKGLGSFLIAIMVASLGRVVAFDIAISGWLIVGCGFLLTAYTIEGDVRRNNAQMLQVVENERLKRLREAEEVEEESVTLESPTKASESPSMNDDEKSPQVV